MSVAGWDVVGPPFLILVGILTFFSARSINEFQATALGRSGDQRFIARYMLLTRVIGGLLAAVGIWELASAVLNR